MGALIRSRLWAGMGVALLLTVVGFPTAESRAQEQSPAPQISDGEVEAIRTYLLSPGYVEQFKTRASGKIGFQEGPDAEPWSDRINRAIFSGAAGAKACGTTFAMPGEAPDVRIRIVGRDTWTAEDIQAQLDLPANTNVPNIVRAMLDRVTTNGLVSLSDDTGQRPAKDYFFYVPAPTSGDNHRIFALYRAAFGLPVGPDAFGSGLFSYFIGGGSIDALAGPPGEEEERICRAMNLQAIFCNPIEGEVTSERIKSALQSALEHCHRIH